MNLEFLIWSWIIFGAGMTLGLFSPTVNFAIHSLVVIIVISLILPLTNERRAN